MVKKRKMENVPMPLVNHIEREMRELNFNTRVQAMEHIAQELDNLVIKRRRRR